MRSPTTLAVLALAAPLLLLIPSAAAQDAGRPGAPVAPGASPGPAPGVVPAPVSANGTGAVDRTEYRIGPEDVLQISIWKNEAMSRTVPVRPDGKVTLAVKLAVPDETEKSSTVPPETVNAEEDDTIAIPAEAT